jgi:dipeptidyl aminopeptidase/acylaminoacyl peptidase
VIRASDGESAHGNLLVDAHGGPQSYALLDHAAHPYWPVLCARGWTVLALNPVGSSSYGEEFARRLLGEWGRGDLKQVLAAVDQLQRDGIAKGKVAITGKSYGGYLSAWAIGQTRRFAAAVVSAPVVNLESHMGCSDSGYYVSPYAMDATPEEQRKRYHDLSPVEHLENVTTPTLILQGQSDERCPAGQSEELFSALMRNCDVATELVLYPGANHQLASHGKPSMRKDYHQRLVEWLQRWCA